MDLGWATETGLDGLDYTCGWCGREPTSAHGFDAQVNSNIHGRVKAHIRICSRCDLPTFMATFGFDSRQVPRPRPGREVGGLSDTVQTMYNEIRNALAGGAPSAAVMTARALLVHLAADRGGGGKDIKTFEAAVDWLASKGWITPAGQRVANEVRKLGNAANHKLRIFTDDEAVMVCGFIERILIVMYEMDSLLPQDEPEP